jgi:hypothetical protein
VIITSDKYNKVLTWPTIAPLSNKNEALWLEPDIDAVVVLKI